MLVSSFFSPVRTNVMIKKDEILREIEVYEIQVPVAYT
jgi:hypothetical protein